MPTMQCPYCGHNNVIMENEEIAAEILSDSIICEKCKKNMIGRSNWARFWEDVHIKKG